MLSILEILLPIFALILAGYVCRRRNIFGPDAATELNRFVVWLALPALLFDTMAHASWQQLYQPAFIATFAASCACAFAVILAFRLASGLHLADAGIDAIAASYPNTAYIGFPLCLALFGSSSLTPATIATIFVACVLFAVAIVFIEIGLQTERQPVRIGAKVLKSLARNPLILSPLAGVLFAAAKIPLPDSIEAPLKLLSGAACPCALVCLGVFLAGRRPATADATDAAAPRSALLLAGIKLLVQPGLAWLLATRVFALPAGLANMTIVLAALPTGTGPFMLAEFYRREAQVASRAILFSTLGSLLSLSVLLLYVGPRG